MGAVYEASHLRLVRRFAVSKCSSPASATARRPGPVQERGADHQRPRAPAHFEVIDFNHAADGVPIPTGPDGRYDPRDLRQQVGAVMRVLRAATWVLLVSAAAGCKKDECLGGPAQAQIDVQLAGVTASDVSVLDVTLVINGGPASTHTFRQLRLHSSSSSRIRIGLHARSRLQPWLGVQGAKSSAWGTPARRSPPMPATSSRSQ